jgi:hypothetical protein
MSDWLKIIGIFAVALVLIYSILLFDGKRRLAAEARCDQSEECIERRSRNISRSVTELVPSSSGKVFFRGKECSSNCEKQRVGYLWAEKVGLTKEEGCDQADRQIRKGCLIYYTELLEDENDVGEPPDAI